jgi:hypothetical protein
MTEQAWFDEAQKITCEFVQSDEALGMRMLDCSNDYWEQSFFDGLTPQQALDRLISYLSGD